MDLIRKIREWFKLVSKFVGKIVPGTGRDPFTPPFLDPFDDGPPPKADPGFDPVPPPDHFKDKPLDPPPREIGVIRPRRPGR